MKLAALLHFRTHRRHGLPFVRVYVTAMMPDGIEALWLYLPTMRSSSGRAA